MTNEADRICTISCAAVATMRAPALAMVLAIAIAMSQLADSAETVREGAGV